MNRIADYAAVLRSGSTARLEGTHPADPLLQSLLVHTAFADGQVDDSELDLLGRVRPDLDPTTLLMWTDTALNTPMDLDALLEAFPLPSDRQALVELAKAMSRADGRIDQGEAQLVDMLRSLVHL